MTNKKPDIQHVHWDGGNIPDVLQRFLNRPTFDEEAEKAAATVLRAVRREGDRAVLRYARKFDGCKLTSDTLKVTEEEIEAAASAVDADFRQAARDTRNRIETFATAGLRKDWRIATPEGGYLGEQYTPLDRVGAYVPGGAAPLVSTALMTVTFASVAGVPEIVACSPAGPDGTMNPYMLYAMHLAGATEIYRIGGAHAVAAMAFGTETIRPVLKIVGPGGAYVTAAKRQVYGFVDLDLVAGPSEVGILADSTAHPRFVAADLLAQAEHGTGHEKALLVTTSTRLAKKVVEELHRQTQTLSRSERIAPILESGTLIVGVKNLKQGMELCNRFAPEHFEILVKNPEAWLPEVRSAGAIFLGPWTPEVAGDFAAGPSHVLPTGGAARMFSGLTVEDFRTKSSVLNLDRKDLEAMRPTLAAFSRVEGLDAHGRSAELRFD